ncbi:polysulfide reductase NrfD, partial [bacterium]|nr:polysulfide reductase NrfD [bacterium]
SAVTMCLLFVVLDMGAPEKFWHLIPFIGYFNFPQSILAWDVLVLNVYLALNLFLVFYAIWKMYKQEEYNHKLMWPFILFSIPAAISIHTVTAFIYAGLGARPFWNAAILAPRFIASAFCSGPAFMLIIFQIIRKRTTFEISDKALLKISEIITFAMAFNLFLLGSEIFKEVYSDSQHIAALHYLYTGLHGHDRLVPWIWSAMAFNLTAFGILIIPSLRKNFTTLNIACVLIFAGVYIEKGIGLVFPGFIPSTMGDIYEYFPNTLEIMISLGIWAFGLLIFTILTKIALAVKSGELRCSCTETKSR